MNAKERGDRVLGHYCGLGMSLRKVVEEEVQCAIEEEREACARIAEADSLLTAWPLTRSEHEREMAVKCMVARAIRARGEA